MSDRFLPKRRKYNYNWILKIELKILSEIQEMLIIF